MIEIEPIPPVEGIEATPEAKMDMLLRYGNLMTRTTTLPDGTTREVIIPPCDWVPSAPR